MKKYIESVYFPLIAGIFIVAGLILATEGIKWIPVWRPEKLHYTDIKFITDDSTRFTIDSFANKWTIVNLFFTRCGGICPKLMSALKQVYKQIQDASHIQIVSITVDPDFDRPHILRKYRKMVKIPKKRWYLLTGHKQDIYRFAIDALGLFALDQENNSPNFIHSEEVVLIDPRGRVLDTYDILDNKDRIRLMLHVWFLKNTKQSQ